MRRAKQIEESKALIAEAFMRLLKTRSYESMSVSMIAAEAGVGRNTFYNHFKTKDELVNHILERLLDRARRETASGEDIRPRDALLWRFALLKENPWLSKLHDERQLRTLLLRFREENITLFRGAKAADRYAAEFVLGGIDYVTARWMRDGMAEPPESIVGTIIKLIGR